MTHDELLAKIDNLDGKGSSLMSSIHGEWCSPKDTCNCSNEGDEIDNAFKALRLVVGLHKPTKEEIWGNYNCEECRKGNADRWVQYPCPTIEAIERELG